MNRALVRSVLLPVHERLRGRPTLSFLAQFRANDRRSSVDLAALRDQLLASLIEHAGNETPRWRRHFRNCGSDGKAMALERLPSMDKSFIRESLEDLVATTWRNRVFKLATGGSSGEPLIFYTDKRREASQLAAKLRAREWWGIRPGDREVCLWGSPIEIDMQDRLRAFKDRLMNLKVLPAFKMTDESLSTYSRQVASFGADYLYGYASVLARWSRFLRARNEFYDGRPLKAAIATAELLNDDDKCVIEERIGCAVINEYGCRDGGLIAQTCPSGSLHIMSDCVVVEILGDEGEVVAPGEIGEICVTNLHSFGMPVIRYRLGDRGSLAVGNCDCGLPHPCLGRLEGRRTDTLFTPGGNRVHGLGAMYVLRVLPGVAAYRVIQDAIDHVLVLIVPRGNPDESELEKPIVEGLQKLLGGEMCVEVCRVAELPALASGKLRAVWNRLED